MDLATARQRFEQNGPDRVEVVYDPGDGGPAEDGVITAVSELFVFVRYGDDTGSRATSAAALTLASDVVDMGYQSLPAELQAAVEAAR